MSIGKTAEYVTFVKNTDSSVASFKATKIRFSADRRSVTVLSWGDNLDDWILSMDTYYYMYGLADIKVTGYALPGSPEMAENAMEAIGDGSSCLLANHGAVAVGKDMDAAFRVCTVLEMTSQIYYMARCIGNPKPIDNDKVAFMKDFVANHYGQRD